MLSNIKRRNQIPEKVKRRSPKKKGAGCCTVTTANYDMETKLVTLRDEIELSKIEIQKLKKQQQDMELLLTTLQADTTNNARNDSNSLLMILSENGEEIFAQKTRAELEKN